MSVEVTRYDDLISFLNLQGNGLCGAITAKEQFWVFHVNASSQSLLSPHVHTLTHTHTAAPHFWEDMQLLHTFQGVSSVLPTGLSNPASSTDPNQQMSLSLDAPRDRLLHVYVCFPSPPGPLALMALLQDSHTYTHMHARTHTPWGGQCSAPLRHNSTALVKQENQSHRPRQMQHLWEECMSCHFIESH